MKRSLIETLLGAVVLVIAGFFVYTAYSSSQISGGTGYPLKATFDKIDGVSPGTDVRISGIKVGTVTNVALDPVTFLATVTLAVDEKYQLPTDTVAAVASEGLLGGYHMSLVPGGSSDMMKPGDTFQYTQSPTSLSDLIGRFVFSTTGQKGQEQEAGPQQPAAPASPAPAAPASPAPTAQPFKMLQ